MAKIRQLNKEKKSCIQQLAQEGMSHADIATIYSIDQTKIWRVVKQGIPLSPKKRSTYSRPRLTSRSTYLRMVVMVKEKPSITSQDLQNSIPTLTDVSKRTIHQTFSWTEFACMEAIKEAIGHTEDAKKASGVLQEASRFYREAVVIGDV